MLRTRWAAIGAAVAVTLGAGGIGLVSATSPSDAVTLVPIEPCRLVDTRPDFQVGPRSSPLGPNETFTTQATGDNGECTGIPASATGLSMNVTAVGPTLATVLTIWGAGDRPNASSLNPTPGQPPTPNAVTSGLTGTGQLNVWNAFGSVHVIIDIVGYYTDHDHDDRYYTEAETDENFVARGDVLFATVAPADASPVLVRGSGATEVNPIGTGWRVTFERDITTCTWIATYGPATNVGVDSRWATVRGLASPNDVMVVLRDDTGAQVDGSGFHLGVFCPPEP